MARCEFTGPDEMAAKLETLGRDGIRRLVTAGAEACKKEMQLLTDQYRHVVTGSMMRGIAAGKYHEDLNSAWCEVYPQGTDSRGVSNAKKAFVINYGYGKRKTAKTGDKFITGKNSTMKRVVAEAMTAENDRIIREMNGG